MRHLEREDTLVLHKYASSRIIQQADIFDLWLEWVEREGGRQGAIRMRVTPWVIVTHRKTISTNTYTTI